MKRVVSNLMPAVAAWLLCYLDLSTGDEIQQDSDVIQEEYCLSENFQPQCMKNEVILIKTATYGRMRIGRCITASEIDNLRSHHLGCSKNILPFLDRKCSGKTDCEIRVIDISAENTNPCPLSINVYLEVSYDCISIVDERRSCAVDATNNPVHIVSSTSCGSNSQPWIVEAPVGQKLSIGLIDFAAADSSSIQDSGRQSCHNIGVIVDKASKTNVSICVGGTQREKKLYVSSGNLVHIFLTHPDPRESNENERKFILRLQAIGCSNIIPPVDGYSKRNGDSIVIGCYTSRKTWHLNCKGGKWVGVIGNCSQGVSALDPAAAEPTSEAAASNEQALIFVVIGGFTLALCLAIVCFGIVCLRRFRVKNKTQQEYKTLNYNFSSTRSQPSDQRIHNFVAQGLTGNDVHGMNPQQMPTYSVFVGDGEFNNDVINSVSVENGSSSVRQ